MDIYMGGYHFLVTSIKWYSPCALAYTLSFRHLDSPHVLLALEDVSAPPAALDPSFSSLIAEARRTAPSLES